MSTTTTIDLMKFADSEWSWVQAPFNLGGWTYATDGRICVRIPTAEPDSEVALRSAPRLPGWDRCSSADTPWPHEALVPTESQCPTCWGTGKAEDDCDACIDGYVDCPHCGNETECTDCGGEGVVQSDDPCEECEGKGKTYSFDGCAVTLGVVRVGGRYFQLISELAGVHYVVPTDPDAPVMFRFDGGEGLLMPLACT